ncbi:MAG TPA: hypothetical protein VFH23_15870 [Jiangellaceae bacterium]|nr:hypothetical protein [Jiangellaceae bacterium]
MSDNAQRLPRGVVAVAGWFAAAILAAGVTLAAVMVIGSGIFGESTRTRSQAEVAQALASLSPPSGSAASPATATSSPSPSPSPQATGSASNEPSSPDAGSGSPSRRLIASAGGSVLAQCSGRDIVVLSWTPAQGYRVEEIDQEARHDVEVLFGSEDDEVKVAVRCEEGQPVADIEQED